MKQLEALGRVSTLLIQRDRMVREGVKALLAGSQFVIEHEAMSIQSAMEHVLAGFEPQLVILDFQNSDSQAVDHMRRLAERLPLARIVVLTHSFSPDKLGQVLEAGADAYLLNDMSVEALIQSLALTMMGETMLPKHAVKFFMDRHIDLGNRGRVEVLGALTEREMQILGCLAKGDPNKRIARRLSISESAVKVYMKALLRKINVHNRTQAAIWAVSHGIDSGSLKPMIHVMPDEDIALPHLRV